MSEAIWIELIKILPTFMWICLGVAVLVIAKRLLSQQAHRMTRVESPFVSVDFAQDAIAQAFNRGPETPAPDPNGTTDVPGPVEGPLSPDEAQWRQEVASDSAVPDWVAPGGQPGSGAPPTGFGGAPPTGGSAAPGTWHRPTPAGDPDQTHALRPAQRPAGESTSDEEEFDLASFWDEDVSEADRDGVRTAPAEREPRSAETPPSSAAPVSPPSVTVPAYPPGSAVPAYSPIPAQQGFQHAPSGTQVGGTSAYRPPSYFAATADPNRGLRAATRLAGAADLLQGGAILWVDDHHHWNEPLVRLFRTAGMKVDAVGTTDEALRHLDRAAYDLVITDLRRERDPGDVVAGMALLDRMVARGVPTPAVVFSDNPQVRTMSHPRAAATTNNPEELVDRVVDLVAHRRNVLQQPQSGGRGGFLFGNG